ncbi:helix-turn-helix domain-containing protein [Paenibacillus peoriae]|uniref:Helix-turn-helix domain-containing protein n=1 Tax=Paenibacillus peoriae TaxID=59893 RepID=A0A7H0Y349_9BACL|nr:helix-turn-helix domain-containing protein [Paenibacillus peoriae]QNR65507.1 helix-turn-helix domain-containing protein [Paenibacillus peoriae]
MNQCVQCGSASMIKFKDTIEHEENGKVYVIEGIEAFKCESCDEVYYTTEGSKQIDKQLTIFRAEGFDNSLHDVAKQKGLTQKDLGLMLDLSHQRVSQIMNDTSTLDVKTMIKIANTINEPVDKVFKFKRIENRDNKYYIV